MNGKLLVGGVLLLVAGVPATQYAREHVFRTAGRKAYLESVVSATPIHFGRRVLEVEDGLPFEAVPPEHREDRQLGSARVLLDGVELLRPEPLEIRPGRAKGDLGRYHLWIHAQVLTDRTSGRQELWFGRRVGEERALPLFEVVRIDATGGARVDTASLADRASSYPLFLLLQHVTRRYLTVHDFSLFAVWPTLIIPFLFPWLTLLIGLVATGLGLAQAVSFRR